MKVLCLFSLKRKSTHVVCVGVGYLLGGNAVKTSFRGPRGKGGRQKGFIQAGAPLRLGWGQSCPLCTSVLSISTRKWDLPGRRCFVCVGGGRRGMLAASCYFETHNRQSAGLSRREGLRDKAENCM